MNISEKHIAVKLGLDKTSSLSLPAFEPEEIDFWLNKAQEKIVDQSVEDYKLNGVNSKMYDYIRPLLETFSSTSAITKSINKDELVPLSGTHAFRKNIFIERVDEPTTPLFKVEFSEEIRYVLSVYAIPSSKTLEDGSVASGVRVYRGNLITEEDSINYMTTDVNTPYFENPVYYLTQDYGYSDTLSTPLATAWDFTKKHLEVVIIWDAFTTAINKVYLSVIRNPIAMSSTVGSEVNCELPEITHHKIVDLAVLMMIENIESPRVQTNAQLLSL